MDGDRWRIIHADALDALRAMGDESVDAVVTDPPAGISFMGKEWDGSRGGRDQWIAWLAEILAECLRVAKPGAHALVWAIPRTSHWTARAVEDAGWEIRDVIHHVHGQGFPKQLDASKAIDKLKGAERKVVAYDATRARPNRRYDAGAIGNIGGSGNPCDRTDNGATITAPATQEARQWDGWKTALKPAVEHWILARKPLDGTVAENVLKYGTGALNVDGCRVPHGADVDLSSMQHCKVEQSGHRVTLNIPGYSTQTYKPGGRYPSNLTHDGSPEVVGLFPVTGPARSAERGTVGKRSAYGERVPQGAGVRGHDDLGGSSARFYNACLPDPDPFIYCPKAAAEDRDSWGRVENTHPTVKATALMRHLCRLVTPPGGFVLDPFAGSGSTGRGAVLEGFRFVGIEREAEYVEIARARILDAVSSSGLAGDEDVERANQADGGPVQLGLLGLLSDDDGADEEA